MSKFRVVLTGVFLGVLILVTAPAGAKSDGNGARVITSRAALERSLVGEINARRAMRGLRPLYVSTALASSARSHSLDMVRSGYFAHESPNGAQFTDRVRRYYGSRGFRYWRAGETLLWSSPDIDAREAVRMWLNSPGHRRILLAPDWREIGMSAVHSTSAPRLFRSLEVTIVTANFGTRSK